MFKDPSVLFTFLHGKFRIILFFSEMVPVIALGMSNICILAQNLVLNTAGHLSLRPGPLPTCCLLRLSGLVFRPGGSIASLAYLEKLFSLIEDEDFLLVDAWRPEADLTHWRVGCWCCFLGNWWCVESGKGPVANPWVHLGVALPYLEGQGWRVQPSLVSWLWASVFFAEALMIWSDHH